MERQPVSGDLILLSKVEGPHAVLISNSRGGPGLLICSERSNVINANRSIEMYKVLIGGKISHITKDRILKILSKGHHGVFLEK
jgi:hypothetical protein|tara:strand:+ start:252 stop:503 length:252 start_codon:yes stop_codon:yes gene_type:complete